MKARHALRRRDSTPTDLCACQPAIAAAQLRAGQVNQLAVLNAQQTYLTAVVSRVLAEANRLSDTAALFVALGGGWPATCQTSLWRECVLEGTAPAIKIR